MVSNDRQFSVFISHIEMVFIAGSHNQGLRRLSQSFVTDKVESSSQDESTFENKRQFRKKDGSDNSAEIPLKLSKNAAREVLRNIMRHVVLMSLFFVLAQN